MKRLIAASPLSKFFFEPWRTKITENPALLMDPYEKFEIHIRTSNGSFNIEYGVPFLTSELPHMQGRLADAQGLHDWLIGETGDGETNKYGIVEIELPSERESLDTMIAERDILTDRIATYNKQPNLTDDQKIWVRKAEKTLSEILARIDDKVKGRSSKVNAIHEAQKKADAKVIAFLKKINQMVEMEKYMLKSSNKGEFHSGVTELVAEYVTLLNENASHNGPNELKKFVEGNRR